MCNCPTCSSSPCKNKILRVFFINISVDVFWIRKDIFEYICWLSIVEEEWRYCGWASENCLPIFTETQSTDIYIYISIILGTRKKSCKPILPLESITPGNYLIWTVWKMSITDFCSKCVWLHYWISEATIIIALSKLLTVRSTYENFQTWNGLASELCLRCWDLACAKGFAALRGGSGGITALCPTPHLSPALVFWRNIGQWCIWARCCIKPNHYLFLRSVVWWWVVMLIHEE